MRSSLALVFAVTLALVGCEKKDGGGATSVPSAPSATTPNASATASAAPSFTPPNPQSIPLLKYELDCPSAVPGSTTSVADTPDGVAITVTAKADLATQTIRERVTRLVSASRVLTVNAGLATAQKNDDLDGGGLAKCPVVTDATTTVDGKDVEGGSKITVRADKPDQVAALQKEAKARAAALPKK